MKFGKIQAEEIDTIHFDLPLDHPQGQKMLKQQASRTNTQIYVGCPVWVNKKWIGSTYPLGTKDKDFLKHYTRQFNSIELNTTHYSLPPQASLERWKKQSQKGFKYSPKFLQEISHQKILEGKAQELTKVFCDTLQELGDSLGLSFLQLPPYFAPKDFRYLELFLEQLPPSFPLSIEVRHPQWFQQNHLDMLGQLLQAHQAATVITDVAGRRDVLHMYLSSPKVMIRFVGNSLHTTDYQRCDQWVQRIKEWIDLGMEEIYFFVHQPDNDLSPDLVRYFIQKLNQEAHLQIVAPKIFQTPVQGSLF